MLGSQACTMDRLKKLYLSLQANRVRTRLPFDVACLHNDGCDGIVSTQDR